MNFDIHTLILISCVMSLASWSLTSDRWSISKFFATCFGISAMAYVSYGIFAFTLGNLAIWHIIRDLVIMGGVSSVFLIFKKNLFASALFYSLLILAIPKVWEYGNERASESAQLSGLDPNAELLIAASGGQFSNEAQSFLDEHGWTVTPLVRPKYGELTDIDDVFTLDIAGISTENMEDIINTLSKLSGVEWVERNEVLKLIPIEGTPTKSPPKVKLLNDPLITNQWSFRKLEMESYFEYIQKHKIKPRKKAKLFVLDSGIEASHEDLKSTYKTYDKGGDEDSMGHGTHCAGIAAAVSNNKIGIASFAPSQDFVQLSSIKVTNFLGLITQASVVEAVIKAVDAGADVINLSIGGVSIDRKERAYDEVFEYARKKSTIVIAAAGNANRDAAGYSPVNSKGVIGVSALSESGERAFFSNTLENIKYGIAAPGENIMSTFKGNTYKALSGTSMAAPHVAGLVSIMKSIKPELTVEDVYTILNNTGSITDGTTKTGKCIHPMRAIQLLYEEGSN